jgi:hypothetical protein
MSLLVTEMKKIYFTLKSQDFSISELAEWILSVCLNIHTLKVYFPIEMNGLFNEIGRFKTLKKLEVLAVHSSELKEFIYREVTYIALSITTTLLPRRFLGAVARWKYSGCMYVTSLWGIWLNGNQPKI